MKISHTCAFCQKSFYFDEKYKDFLIGPQFCCIAHLREFVEKFDPLSYCYRSEDEIDADPIIYDKKKVKEILRLGHCKVVNPTKAFAVFDDTDGYGGSRYHEWCNIIEEDNNSAYDRLSKYRCDPDDCRIVVDKERKEDKSKLLGESFRSTYEVDVIEVMKISWGWKDLLYEPHGIKMFYAGENQERMYIPDWYDPNNVVYFEVKGIAWDKRSKEKVEALSEKIGWRRMILIHPMYGSEFRNFANQLRKSR